MKLRSFLPHRRKQAERDARVGLAIKLMASNPSGDHDDLLDRLARYKREAARAAVGAAEAVTCFRCGATVPADGLQQFADCIGAHQFDAEEQPRQAHLYPGALSVEIPFCEACFAAFLVLAEEQVVEVKELSPLPELATRPRDR